MGTIYRPPDAVLADGRQVLVGADEVQYLREHGAREGEHWTSEGLLPNGGRIWIREEKGYEEMGHRRGTHDSAPVDADLRNHVIG